MSLSSFWVSNLQVLRSLLLTFSSLAYSFLFFRQGQSSSVEMMALVGLCLLPVDNKAAYIEAIKAVHCYPERLEPWCVLLKASENKASSCNLDYSRILALTKAVSNLKNCTTNQPLITWIEQQ